MSSALEYQNKGSALRYQIQNKNSLKNQMFTIFQGSQIDDSIQAIIFNAAEQQDVNLFMKIKKFSQIMCMTSFVPFLLGPIIYHIYGIPDPHTWLGLFQIK